MEKIYYFICICLFTACDILDKDEDVPSFIYISEADLTTLSEEGANTHDIPDVHVFADEQFVGTFELPANIPILAAGPTRLNISAGIKNNGISSRRIIYPFYAPINVEYDLIPGLVTPVDADSSVTFSYFPTGSLTFFNEDFEGTGSSLAASEESIAVLATTNNSNEVRSGFGSGKILFNEEADYFFATTTWNLVNLPRGRTMYLEVDYRGDQPLEVGIRSLNPVMFNYFVLGMNPRTEWTKFYIDLTQIIASLVQTTSVQIYFESRKSPGAASGEIYIDNLKFVLPN